MPNTRIVLARGAADGVNVLFYTPEPYVPGSVAYILNGKVYSQFVPRGPSNPFGFVESRPDFGEVQVDFAPHVGDVVQLLFWDRRPTLTASIQDVAVVVETQRSMIGVVADKEVDQITGVLQERDE